VNKDLQNIVFILKFGKDCVRSAPVGEAKINNINAIDCYGDTVYHNENPSCNVLVNLTVPESERDNL
jgi:hypothetical protein